MTMQVIQHIELTGTQATIEFTSIPQDATDLLVLYSFRPTNTAVDVINVSFNGSTTSFSNRYLDGSGSTVASGTGTRYVGAFQGTTSSTFANSSLYIPNYTSSNHKSYSVDSVSEANQAYAIQTIIAGLWSNTSAITSISFSLAGTNFAAGSSATLYGITKGSDGTTTVS